ncbi:hypothetical protein ACIO3S_20260 [Nocardioides sp. NPDC087217]|uniref:hypothetical protein n=1 Tax=Nocardioides sp. NPDC087217 TaxID=3364335 RepID=UPI003803BA4E
MTTTPETRPFRFGVVAAQAPTGAAWSDLARRVESADYDTLVMPDNAGPRRRAPRLGPGERDAGAGLRPARRTRRPARGADRILRHLFETA